MTVCQRERGVVKNDATTTYESFPDTRREPETFLLTEDV